MKKINITQLENDLLSSRELQKLQGGYGWCYCPLYDNDVTDLAFTGQNTPYPGGGGTGNPGGPGSCPCTLGDEWGYGSDAATSYM